jgi:hypothetical protein
MQCLEIFLELSQIGSQSKKMLNICVDFVGKGFFLGYLVYFLNHCHVSLIEVDS